jgi:hypothetical protein
MMQNSGPTGSSARAQPRTRLVPAPFVHPDLAPAPTLAIGATVAAAAAPFGVDVPPDSLRDRYLARVTP